MSSMNRTVTCVTESNFIWMYYDLVYVCVSVKKGFKCNGNANGEGDCVKFEAGRPREGLSARFKADGT